MQRSRLIHWLTPRRAIVGCVLIVTLQITYFLHRSHSFPWQAGAVRRQNVVHQLATLTNAYTTNSANASVGIVLASIHTDDLTWLLDYSAESGNIPFVYTTEKPPESGLLLPHTVRGREAAAYLSYITDYYDHLPDYSIFVHAFPEQWHNDLFGPYTQDTLRNIRLESIDVFGYVNLRCKHNPGCPTSVFPLSPSEADIKNHDIRATFSEAYQQIMDVPLERVPGAIGNVCCGQFAVSRDRIRARPKEDYERILNWAATTKLTDSFGVGWVLEKLWHIIFGMEVVYCPRYEQCRCDVYGWCGPLPSGESLQAVTRPETASSK